MSEQLGNNRDNEPADPEALRAVMEDIQDTFDDAYIDADAKGLSSAAFGLDKEQLLAVAPSAKFDHVILDYGYRSDDEDNFDAAVAMFTFTKVSAGAGQGETRMVTLFGGNDSRVYSIAETTAFGTRPPSLEDELAAPMAGSVIEDREHMLEQASVTPVVHTGFPEATANDLDDIEQTVEALKRSYPQLQHGVE